jgi:hypothetical protein
MMAVAIDILVAILSLYGGLYLVTAIANPSTFMDYFALEEVERQRGVRAWYWIKATITFFAVGAAYFFLGYGIFQVIPEAWGSFDEEGSWQQWRSVLQMLFSLACTASTLDSAEKRARRAVLSEIESTIEGIMSKRLLRAMDRKTVELSIQEVKGLDRWRAEFDYHLPLRSEFAKREFEHAKGRVLDRLELRLKEVRSQ